ncbi:FecCD family ABC transporter permease [Gynurincola endophyticus]|jgi:iron complex transport system permease protein|uniref:FecCD family ABC transporter permease n=1 Tax=Gynurincola endophyticus TaxID=2479004 RepID=UPI000F8E9C44|nr:iron ABC transporter permease [Gynurincola endophyticus]
MTDHITIQHTARQQAEEDFHRLQHKRKWIIGVLALLCLTAFCFDIALGPSSLAIKDVLIGLFNSSAVDDGTKVIIWQIRMPYAIMAVLVGMALSLAGAEMQTILNNPLASPFTLGVSASATLGAALAIIAGISIPGVPDNWIISVNAFLFAFASVLLLQAVSKWLHAGVGILVLFGIALVFTFNALVALLHYIATPEALQQVIFWSMGSLARSNWDKVQLLTIVLVVVLPFSFSAAWKMTALRLGEDRAAGFGINVQRLRFASLFRISLLAATAVAFVGTIGFIGLVGPHIARMLIGEDHRYWFPASLLTGALIMSLSSIASKMLIPGVLLPIGIVTALAGVPLFIYLIIKKGRRM